MKTSIAVPPARVAAGSRQRVCRRSPVALALAAALACSFALADEPAAADGSVLKKSDYRLPMEQVIAIGRIPYWRKEQAPQWEREEMELKESKSRLQWAPAYTRDERDEYDGIRDSTNPKARAKVFEVKF